ncbi:tRNA lysidine(34) synthetase TilS [Phenylobacterium sp.]|uniref:tRNA lysidine(34) synthetase TilS n=1 Tax=Phenylobacterium sp. TaxID=1871053 RepID=UPI0028122DFE|nr:tRNA lysidine(34) synthetase TilS [Phenylobacterium sp.]
MRGLEPAVRAHLDRRLSLRRDRPLAVAFSGGGDSLALLLIADAWARKARRELVVLTVDHRLQPESAAWTRGCADVAARLGRPFRALSWEGEKPARGLPAAARAARHRLLADAARQDGASVLLMGHTADDVLEARRMRAEGSTTPEPRVWAPSPAWPEGRGVFLLRPLLEARRAALRDWLVARGERWTDDPANADPRYARARARPFAAADDTAPPEDPAPLQVHVEEALGVLVFERDALEAAGEAVLGMTCVCAGGGSRRPPSGRIGRIAAALSGREPLVATLAGARIEADETKVRIFREAGEAARGGLASVELEPGATAVWDGRFEFTASRRITVRRLAGLMARLSKDEQAALRDVPAAARGALPVVLDGELVSCPLLAPDGPAAVRSLVGERLRAAAGLIPREPD